MSWLGGAERGRFRPGDGPTVLTDPAAPATTTFTVGPRGGAHVAGSDHVRGPHLDT